jgi:hypothetical protein
MNEDILKEVGFGKEVEAVKLGLCPFCGCPITTEDFKDELSKEEFKISGLCQKCQDDMFGD